MLKIEGLTRAFGGLVAVSNLDMDIHEGEIVGLIGPNGAGKTTVFNLITGFLRPNRGQITFLGSDITRHHPHFIAKEGIVRTFQQNAFLPDFSVFQNVLISCYMHPECSAWQAILNTPAYVKKEHNAAARTLELLQFLGLYSVKDELAQNLPHGSQRLLGIAIALSAKPRLLLLDEPLTGMNSFEVNEALAIINKIQASGTTVLLVEHNMRAVMKLCHRIVVMSFGKKIAEGLPDEIRTNKDVIEAYLGAAQTAIK